MTLNTLIDLNKKPSSKRSVLIILFLLFSFYSFAAPKSPEFIRTKDWKIEKLSSGKMVLTAKAVFYNPNKAKAKLNDIILNVFANDKLIGTVTQVDKVKIFGNSSLDIPLRIEFNLKDSGMDAMGTFLNLMSNNKFLVDIIGYLKVSVFCLPFKVPVDEKQELSLKDFF